MALPGNYTPDVPQGTQQINVTQQPINYNFQDIADLIAVNHVPFNTANTFGKHTIVEFINQSAAPVTIASEIALYCTTSSNGSLQMFLRYANNGGISQLTPLSSSSSSTSVSAGSFYYNNVSLNSGVNGTVYWVQFQNSVKMYQWSQYSPPYNVSPAPTNPQTFSFPTASGVPTFTQTPFNIQLSMVPGTNPATNTGFCYCATPISATQFKLYYTGTPTSTSSIQPMYVTAIGI